MTARSAAKPQKPPARGTYSSHRERQRRRILDAAEKLFDERGIDRVTVADIVHAAGIQASTLYEYFSNKDDVVWAIVADLLADAAVRAKQAMDPGETALAKITALLDFMADGLTKHPSKIRFMAQFDAMYARDWSPERLLSLEAQLSPRGFQYFSALIRGRHRGRVAPSRSGPGSYDACRYQRRHRSAATARVLGQPGGG